MGGVHGMNGYRNLQYRAKVVVGTEPSFSVTWDTGKLGEDLRGRAILWCVTGCGSSFSFTSS